MKVYQTITVSALLVGAYVLGQTLFPLPVSIASPGGSSVGANGQIQSANGSGGFLDSGCNIFQGEVRCATFTTTRTIVHGGKTCYIFPDSSVFNTDISSYPLDPLSSTYIAQYIPANPTISAASWATGTVTATVNTSVGLVDGNSYFINGISPSGYNPASFVAVHVIDSSHVSYPIVSNPGSYTSGGIVWKTALRLGSSPSMALNFADNTTATPAITWQAPGTISDAGFWPLLSSFVIEDYVFGSVTTITTPPMGGDNHVFTVNMDTCQLYEMFSLQTGTPPYLIANGAIWDLNTNDLRMAKKLTSDAIDTTGLTSADVAGLPIWPLVLTYAELFAGTPIKHPLRFTTANPQGQGWIWPGSHGCNSNCDANKAPPASRFRLRANFDETTCHFLDCNGQAWPAYMVRLIQTLKKYGMFLADGGGNGLITTDSDQSWGDPNVTTDPNYVLAGFLHGIQLQDFEVISHDGHIVNVLSGATH